MAADNQLRTYGDVSIVEDVLPAIEILTAQENFLLNSLSKGGAVSTVVETQTDTLAVAASAAVTEGGDATIGTSGTPVRLTNIIEHIAIPFSVTGTQRRVTHFSGEDELARQTRKALMDWGNAAEFDLLRASLTSGASGTAPVMNGLIVAASKSTNHTSHTSGTTWSASILDGLMRDNWDNSNGDVAVDLLVSPFTRQKTDEFTQKTNTFVQGDQTVLVRTTSIFATSFGNLNLRTHRYVVQSGDATDRVVGVRPDKLEIAYLARPFIQPLSSGGDHEDRQVFGSLSLRVRNQDSQWFADGFKKS